MDAMTQLTASSANAGTKHPQIVASDVGKPLRMTPIYESHLKPEVSDVHYEQNIDYKHNQALKPLQIITNHQEPLLSLTNYLTTMNGERGPTPGSSGSSPGIKPPGQWGPGMHPNSWLLASRAPPNEQPTRDHLDLRLCELNRLNLGRGQTPRQVVLHMGTTVMIHS